MNKKLDFITELKLKIESIIYGMVAIKSNLQ